MVTITMSKDEARYLQDLLEMWAEGYDGTDGAVKAVEADTIFETVQQYSDCVQGINDDKVMAQALLLRLQMETA